MIREVTSPSWASVDAAQEALARAREHLLSLQDDAGWWKGELETNVSMDAEDMLLREFLGIREPETTERTAAWIRSRQRTDGSWTNFFEGPGELSTSVESYVALRLAGDAPELEHMQRAAAYIRGRGGLEQTRVFTHIWMALFGLWSWDNVPTLPAEQILLPGWFPLNVYDFACWARQTVVALSVVLSYRPIRPLPFGIDELHGPDPWAPPNPGSFTGRALVLLDRLLHVYQRHPIRFLRKLALARADRWIVDRQEADGSWGGIQPPMVYSLLALCLRGYDNDHPVIRLGLKGLDRFTINAGGGRNANDDDGHRRVEACQSPVWDTALAMIALQDAGTEPDDDALIRAADWLLGEQIPGRGDWAVRRRDLPAGGWAFEFFNVNYPDTDDTAEVVLALKRLATRADVRLTTAIDRGLSWLEGMQSSDGGWGAFDADNCRSMMRDIPFCDFGEVIDPPSADVTAHAVEVLVAAGRGSGTAAQRGVQWLLENQEEDGSWFGRWGVNHIYGTGAVVPALTAAGLGPGSEPIRRAVRWLEQHQNQDGGWGEDARSYDDPGWIGRGPSTASQTAWALLALHAAGEAGSDSVERGVGWLVDSQLPEGTWNEPQFTGTGFPTDFYINYHLYRLVFPIMALGRLGPLGR
jgi:squalene-hopene/tetraprenyl-beta-curcumene cyclase